jgi:hypothetical protein
MLNKVMKKFKNSFMLGKLKILANCFIFSTCEPVLNTLALRLHAKNCFLDFLSETFLQTASQFSLPNVNFRTLPPINKHLSSKLRAKSWVLNQPLLSILSNSYTVSLQTYSIISSAGRPASVVPQPNLFPKRRYHCFFLFKKQLSRSPW